MTCPVCGQRRGRRACPAVGASICAICCGTKRLTEIACPPDCIYLASSREHPAAVTVRRHKDDLQRVVAAMRDLNERQSRAFLAISAFVRDFRPQEFQTILDEDVREAADALASTLETASRGVIYEHRPQSAQAERLLRALRKMVADTMPGGGSAAERDAAVVLRRVIDMIDELKAPERPRAYQELLGRVLSAPGPDSGQPAAAEESPRLIVP